MLKNKNFFRYAHNTTDVEPKNVLHYKIYLYIGCKINGIELI